MHNNPACAISQMGYNLLYGLYKSSYDADCSLFLGVLRGDVKEDVYIQTAQLQVWPHPLSSDMLMVAFWPEI